MYRDVAVWLRLLQYHSSLHVKREKAQEALGGCISISWGCLYESEERASLGLTIRR
jgi:hypothetical protein